MMIYVYIGSSDTPVAVETNPEWALPYWKKRKQTNPAIHILTIPREKRYRK